MSDSLLAKAVKADFFILLAPVSFIYLNYGTEDQKALSCMTTKEAERFMREGHFPQGSMGPKVEAMLDFVKSGGGEAVIASPARLLQALNGKSGTRIVSDAPGPIQQRLFSMEAW